MKTDNFDEAFRRKVESFHPPFRDDEIDRIQGYVHQHIPLSFWQRFGQTLTYSAGTLAIVTLITYTLFQANENKTLLNKISDLNTQLEQKQANIAKNTPKVSILVKTDTVFVVKYVTKEVPVYAENKNSVRRVFNPSDISETSAITNKKENLNDAFVSPVFNKTSTISNEKENRSINSSTAGRVENPSYNSVRNITSTEKNENIARGNTQNAFAEKPLVKNENIQSENTNNSLIINELKAKSMDFSTSKNFDDLLNRKLNLPHLPIITKAKFPSIAMPNLKYRIGLGTDKGFGQKGASLLTDILFAKRWSITSGINMAFLSPKHFRDEDDFKRKTNKDFRDKYPTNAPIINPIEDIDVHQVLLRVPLYLNYRLPLRKDFTLLFSTGTDFDLSLRQFTSYNHRDFYKDDHSRDIIEKMSVIPFNNLLFSAGIEKRWKHYSVQLSPYFSTQIKQVSYRNENYSFGLKLNGFYRISR